MCVLRENVGVFARMMLAVLLPVAALLAAVDAVVPSRAALLVVVLLVAPALQVPFTLLVARRLFDDKVGVREVLRAAGSAWRAYPLVALSVFASLFLGTVSLGLMWLPAHAGTLWVVEAAALERLSIRRAVGRSLALATSGLGRTMLGSLVSGLLLVWVVLGAELMAQGLVQVVLQLGQPFGALQDGDVTPWMLAGALIAQPVVALYRVILYVDLRTAVEGWDLQVAMMSAAETA